MIDSFSSNGASTRPAALHSWSESYLHRRVLPDFTPPPGIPETFDSTAPALGRPSQDERDSLPSVTAPSVTASSVTAHHLQRDQELADSVSRVINGIGYAVLRKVRVHAHHGQITLTGCVPLYYFKQLAQASLRGIPGVQYVRNELNVG